MAASRMPEWGVRKRQAGKLLLFINLFKKLFWICMTLIKINLNFIKKLTQFWILSTLEFQFQIQFQLLVIRSFNFFEVFIHFSYILTQGYVPLPSFWVILTILPKKKSHARKSHLSSRGQIQGRILLVKS